MDTSTNRFDAIEHLIYTENIRIQAVDIHEEADLMVIILNTGSVLKERLSRFFPNYRNERQQIRNFEFIGNGTGIHWPDLDEDLSLKGFLRDMLKEQITGNVA